MRLVKHWNLVIDKVKGNHSKWKADCLSFGGRLTLFNSVLISLPLFCSHFFGLREKLSMLFMVFVGVSYGAEMKIREKLKSVAWEVVNKLKALGGQV